MATLKSNNAAIAVMQQMLQERCIAEPTSAIKMANPSKSLEGIINYMCSQMQEAECAWLTGKMMRVVFQNILPSREV